MPVFFAANAFWWAYRAGATISRAYLNWEAGRRGTTVEAAFEQARFRAARGQLSTDEVLLLRFVQFNDRFKWTDPQDFALDTSAVATAGLGMLAKVGLGNRILTTFGVKNAPTAGVIIDGIIDAVGAMLTGGKSPFPGVGDIVKAALEVLTGAQQTDLVKRGTAVVAATVKFGKLIQPFLGGPVSPLALVTAVPAIVKAAVDLFGSLLGLWGVVEESLPEPKPGRGMRGDPPLTDPVFRNALAAIERKAPRPIFVKGDLDRALWPTEILTGPARARVAEARERFGRRQIQRLGGVPGASGRLTISTVPIMVEESRSLVAGRSFTGPQPSLWSLLHGPIPPDVREKFLWMLMAGGAATVGFPGPGGDGGDGGFVPDFPSPPR